MVVIGMTLTWSAKGLGQHVIFLFFHLDWLGDGLKYYFIASILYTVAVTCPKYSMLFFYARLFTTRSKAFRYHLWFAGSLVTTWFIYTIISSGATFVCFRPTDTIPHSCITSFTYYTVAACRFTHYLAEEEQANRSQLSMLLLIYTS